MYVAEPPDMKLHIAPTMPQSRDAIFLAIVFPFLVPLKQRNGNPSWIAKEQYSKETGRGSALYCPYVRFLS